MEKDSRAKLLAAATLLFAEKGLVGVSIRELAEAANVNSALISYYFGGKEGLYIGVLEELFSPAAKFLDAFAELTLTPPERIQYYAKAVVSVHKKSPYLMKFVHNELANPTLAFAVIVEKYIVRLYTFVRQAFADGAAEGYFNADLDPSYAAISLAGIMNFYFLIRPITDHILAADAQHDEKYVRQAVNIYLNGVRRINYE
ncbi:MAG: TetR family transcriptional regulator [Pelosinus sp.]|nr:TetR family transcriptional regulator [Pelosinus sp.]